MAHPYYGIVFDILEQHAVFFPDFHSFFAIFADLSRVGVSPQLLGHKLGAVTDSQHGNPQCIDIRVTLWSALFVNTGRTPCKDDPLWIDFLNSFNGYIVGYHLRINACFTHPAGDELVILGTKLDDQNCFSFCHFSSLMS